MIRRWVTMLGVVALVMVVVLNAADEDVRQAVEAVRSALGATGAAPDSSDSGTTWQMSKWLARNVVTTPLDSTKVAAGALSPDDVQGFDNNAVGAVNAAGLSFAATMGLNFSAALTADSTAVPKDWATLPAKATLAGAGKLVYRNGDSLSVASNADTTAGAMRRLGIALNSAAYQANVTVIWQGRVRCSTFSLTNDDAEVWMGATGAVTETVPTTTGNAQRKIGWVEDGTNDVLIFEPSADYTKAL